MRWWSKAPAVAAGAFAFSLAMAHAAEPLALARQLFDDGCWEECRRECERVMAASPDHAGASALKSDASERMAAASRTASSTASWPGRALVWLYRTAIRPAIGARCSLDPSCSEYFLQSSRAHGLLGFTLAADRLVREPSVVHAHADPVAPGGNHRIPDPLSDHDFWMRRSRFRTGPRRRRGKIANLGRGT